MRDDSFKDYILDLLIDFENIKAKGMFGGWGVYKSGVFFGLVSDGELYFKTDNSNIKDYKKHDSYPFEYERKGKMITLSYWLVPEKIMENKDKLYEWAQKSIDINKKL